MQKTILFTLLMIIGASIAAQDFQSPADRFSSKKNSYIYKTDGTELVGLIDDIDRKKGLIEEITLKTESGDKVKLKPEDISHMYLMPSGFDKFATTMDQVYDIQEYDKERGVDNEKIKEGYVLFESNKVKLKKKEMTLLLQLLNPGFEQHIRVYYDPLAKQSASMGIGGFTVAGGDAKSYFVKKGNGTAFKLEKKIYKKEFEKLYDKCRKMKSEYKDIIWTDFNKHIQTYNADCAK